MHGTYVGGGRMLVQLTYGAMLLTSSDDLSITPVLVTRGVLEQPLTTFFSQAVEPGQVVVDVGANIGYFTVLAARLVGVGGRVVAFEANPAAVSLLKDNLALNWLAEHRVDVHGVAVAAAEGTIHLHTSTKFLGDSSIHARPERDNLVDEIELVEVPAVTLDRALADVPHIDLLKIDIEGGEHQAFLGMQRLVEEGRLDRVVFEWNRGMLAGDADALLADLRHFQVAHGASLSALTAEGALMPISLEALAGIDFYPFAVLTFPRSAG